MFHFCKSLDRSIVLLAVPIAEKWSFETTSFVKLPGNAVLRSTDKEELMVPGSAKGH